MCSRCKVAKYCNKDCQRNHWPVHKKSCAQMVELNESGDKLIKDTSAWMDENTALLQCFMLNALRVYGDPEMSLVGTHYAVLMGTYDVACRTVRVTDYCVVEASEFQAKSATFPPPDKNSACVILAVNGTARVRRVPNDLEENRIFGVLSEAVQHERTENAFQALKEMSIGPKFSFEKVARSIQKHDPELAVKHQRTKSLLGKLIFDAVCPDGRALYSGFFAHSLRMYNPATTLKDTHRMMIRVIMDEENVRIVSCTAEPIEKIATFLVNSPGGNPDPEYWRNGDEKDKRFIRESGKPNRFFPCIVHWVPPGALDDEEGGVFLHPNFMFEEHVQQMERSHQSMQKQDEYLQLLIKWANQRPGTFPESSVLSEWRVPPANGGGYL